MALASAHAQAAAHHGALARALHSRHPSASDKHRELAASHAAAALHTMAAHNFSSAADHVESLLEPANERRAGSRSGHSSPTKDPRRSSTPSARSSHSDDRSDRPASPEHRPSHPRQSGGSSPARPQPNPTKRTNGAPARHVTAAAPKGEPGKTRGHADALRFVQRALRDADVQGRYLDLLASSHGDLELIERGLATLGYDTSPAAIQTTLTQLRLDHIELWAGRYAITLLDRGTARQGPVLTIDGRGQLDLSGQALASARFVDGTLGWSGGPLAGTAQFGTFSDRNGVVLGTLCRGELRHPTSGDTVPFHASTAPIPPDAQIDLPGQR